MRRKKKFDFAEGKYYLTIKSIPNDITLSRNDLDEALNVYQRYVDVGKTVTWHGLWDGKKFVEDEIDNLLAA